MFHDLAESEPLETDVAFVSILHIRAVRELTCCKRRHLGRDGIDGLFNTGNSGGDHTQGFTEGLDFGCRSLRILARVVIINLGAH